jgi:hypothetical protein
MSTPALITLGLIAFSLALKAVLHGRHVEVNFHFALLDAATLISLLWWGGFFS